ncbi:helix-turn-helix domain-containing protein [Fusobacterium sp. SB021]|uniref:hypothetical protein n=1 Tax=Fusobacterium sp. SB021 TaxID=2744227 RepID=UPI003CEF6F2F
MENINLNTRYVRERFTFLFDGLDIDDFRRTSAENEKRILDERIKSILREERRKRKQRRIWDMAKDIQDEINEYLIKASKPKNDFEKMLMNKMTKELGTVTSAKELSLFLKIGKSSIYRGLDTGEILSFRSGKRRFILTEGVLPFLRD